MPKAGAGTPKAIANAMKAKGLGKLKWYCQACQKQCRDDNGFKCHIATEGHLRQMLVLGENAGKHLDQFSSEFMSEFIQLLSRRWNTKRVRANDVYQEYIQDKNHIHMNATKWVSLSEFVKYLGKEGIVRVDETEKGFYIAWVDNSPAALARQEAVMKKERSDMDDEQRQRKLLAAQIERAKASETSVEPTPSTASILTREEGSAPIKLSFGMKKPSPPAEDASTSASSSSAPSSAAAPVVGGGFKVSVNPLKRPASGNVFKMASSKSSSSGSTTGGGSVKMSATEKLMFEEEERKKRMGGGGGFGGGNPLKRVKL